MAKAGRPIYGKKIKVSDVSFTIQKHINNPAVTIIIDSDDSSPESQIGSAYSYDSRNKVLTIVASILAKIDSGLLNRILVEAHNEGTVILKATKEDILNSYTKYVSENPDQKTLEFFKPILENDLKLKDDFFALKMSLYLRDQSKKGQRIHNYKNDIRNRFGDRGANIANLCTAGYFENEFMPLYNTVSKNEFYEYYENAVGNKARALFVHFGMDNDLITAEFDNMIAKGLKYHMRDFRVHGIGSQNVFSIKRFFSTRAAAENEKFIIQKTYESASSISIPAIEYTVTFV